MANAAHRKNPNRIRELRALVQQMVHAHFGTRVICGRCCATIGTYGEKCTAPLDERCPGFNAVDLVQVRLEKEVGLT